MGIVAEDAGDLVGQRFVRRALLASGGEGGLSSASFPGDSFDQGAQGRGRTGQHLQNFERRVRIVEFLDLDIAEQVLPLPSDSR
jgi:hypothetical protein